MFMLRRVVGASMIPLLPPKKLVLAKRGRLSLDVGDVVIFTHAGLEKIKRISLIEADGVFVLGDNAKQSTDSRHFGLISRGDIVAKVIWPLRLHK